MNAEVLVLYHHARGVLQRRGDVKRLVRMLPRRLEPSRKLRFLAVLRNGQAVGRADVDAGITFDAEFCLEDGLHVAIEAPLHFLGGLLGVEPEFHFDADLLETFLEAHVRHEAALDGVVVVLVRPLVQAHLARGQVQRGRQALRDGLVHAEVVDRNAGLVAVLDGPDDVLRPERGVATEKDVRARRLEGALVDDRHVPLVELDADVALDPRKGIFLADREDHVVRRQELLARDTLARDAAVRVEVIFHRLEQHADELAILDHERLRRVVHDDLDILRLGILEFPVGRLEKLPRLAGHDLDVLRAEPQRRAAAVHRGVADTDDQHAFADLVDVLERHRLEPVDADVDVGAALDAAGQVQFLALRRAAADEYRIEAAGLEQLAHAVDARVVADLRAHLLDVADLLGEHRLGQPEGGDVRPHQAAGHVPLLEDDDFVAERQQVVRHGQRSGACADARDALAVLHGWDQRQAAGDVVLVVCGDALQSANGHGLVFDTPAPAGRFAGAVTDAPEDARKYVRLAVDHVRVGELAERDQADVFGNVGVGRAGPLAINDPMEIVRVRRVGRWDGHGISQSPWADRDFSEFRQGCNPE